MPRIMMGRRFYRGCARCQQAHDGDCAKYGLKLGTETHCGTHHVIADFGATATPLEVKDR